MSSITCLILSLLPPDRPHMREPLANRSARGFVTERRARVSHLQAGAFVFQSA